MSRATTPQNPRLPNDHEGTSNVPRSACATKESVAQVLLPENKICFSLFNVWDQRESSVRNVVKTARTAPHIRKARTRR